MYVYSLVKKFIRMQRKKYICLFINVRIFTSEESLFTREEKKCKKNVCLYINIRVFNSDKKFIHA